MEVVQGTMEYAVCGDGYVVMWIVGGFGVRRLRWYGLVCVGGGVCGYHMAFICEVGSGVLVQ